ncbi:MAG: tetratricopeptide repeat protein [Acidobacteria bacterium]|nr:tetratricopeptide repeat protein [Acidobacteriota bacterium]
MKILFTIPLVFFAVAFSACSTNLAESSASAKPAAANSEIDAALQLIERAPDSTTGYNQLAVLYIKQARQTGDFSLNNQAESALRKALEIAPNDESARKLQASLHLTFHRFGEALELGGQLVKEYPNDAFVYGVLTDANAELGNYPAAVDAAQKMVDLRPNSNAYARVAHIRSLHGDHAGAVEMYKLAARTADPADKEAQSWCLVQLGDQFLKNGNYSEAERVYDEALQNFSGFYLALAGKGRARAANGDLESAIKYLTEAQARVPNVETAILLADIYTKTGNSGQADEQSALVQAMEINLGRTNDQKRLALFWADRDTNLKEALEIAEREHAVRKDIFTADVYAWCLFKNGRIAEAANAIREAMRLNTGDARMLYHAGMIEKAKGNRAEANRLLNQALKANPQFDLLQADKAKAALEATK